MTVVVIGAGHSGVQAAESLRTEGYADQIVLLDKADHLPYQRPPLSKDYIKECGDPTPMPLRGAAFYDERDIDLRSGTEVTRIDSPARLVCVKGRLRHRRPGGLPLAPLWREPAARIGAECDRHGQGRCKNDHRESLAL